MENKTYNNDWIEIDGVPAKEFKTKL